jgi:outer membrane cobalamin receptor
MIPAYCVRSCMRLAICALAILTCARAQGPADVTDATLEDLMRVKVSTASKYLQPATDAPAFVTVIDREYIERFGYRTLADVLQSVGGFYITYDRNYSYIGVRGFSRPGDYSTKVLLLVNGHRMNDAVYDAALIGTEFPLDLDLVQRVEVIRGPGSSLYGTSAFFAVINVITRTPERDLPALETSFDALSFGGIKGRVTYSHFVRGWDVMASASTYRFDGQTLFFPEFNGSATNNGVTSGTDYDSSYNGFFQLGRPHWRVEALYGSRDKGVPTASYESDFNNPANHTVDDRGYVSLLYTRDIGKWSVTARGAYDTYNYAATYINPPDAQGTRIVDRDFSRADTLSSELQLGRHVGAHFLTVGIDARDNLRLYQANYYVSPRTVWTDDRRSSTVFAGYGQDEYSITKSFLAHVGVRVDRYSTFGKTINPRMALIWKPTSTTDLKLIYGSAFRAPNSYEMYYATRLYQAGQELNPERIHSGEVLLEHTFLGHWRLSGSVFRNNISNLISATDLGDGSISYRNSSSAHAQGVDLRLIAQFDHGLLGRVSYSYIDAHNVGDGNALSNSPHTLIKMGLSVPLVRKLAFASLDGNYVSRRGTLAGSSVPSYLRLDVTLLARQVARKFQISASVYNLANTKFWDPGAQEHLQDRLAQDRRNFRFKLTYALGAHR